MRQQFLMAAILLGGCAGPKTEARAPSAPLVTEPTVDLDEARTVLESFLAARWRFDRPEMIRWVTPEDEEQVPQTLVQTAELMGRLDPSGEWPSWYEWEIVEFEPTEGGHIRARARVLMPTIQATTVAFTNMNMQRTLALARVRNPLKMQVVMKAVQDAFIPPRILVDLNYELRRVDDRWRVHMGWAEMERMLKEKSDPSAFHGSEKFWFERLSGGESERTKEQERTARHIAREARKAENLARERRFDEAVAVYDALLLEHDVPGFIAARPAELQQQREEWEPVRATANLSFEVGQTSSDDRRASIVIRARNDGQYEIKSATAVVVLEGAGGQDSTTTNFRDLGPGEQTESTVKMFRKDETPTVKEVILRNVWFTDESLPRANPPSPEFSWKLSDFRSGRETRYASTRVDSYLRAHLAAVHECPGWTKEPVEFRIDVERSGDLAGVSQWSDGETNELTECVGNQIAGMKLHPTSQPWAVVTRVWPPEYLEQLGE